MEDGNPEGQAIAGLGLVLVFVSLVLHHDVYAVAGLLADLDKKLFSLLRAAQQVDFLHNLVRQRDQVRELDELFVLLLLELLVHVAFNR